eukprot:m.101132 g.101132  ORF g.101132 m.101132 type:complete len:53 (+) comp13193_c0_seq1:112-270(+)
MGVSCFIYVVPLGRSQTVACYKYFLLFTFSVAMFIQQWLVCVLHYLMFDCLV